MPRIIDVIAAPDQGANDLVNRVPDYGNGDFRLGSQVVVRESQRAVFYRDGKSLDVFEPGRHTITTMNLPVLTGLMRLFTGGNDVFQAEVYFVNMREFTDLKWGTPQPISLRDSELGLVRLRGFGQYTMQISDPSSLSTRSSARRALHHRPNRGLSAHINSQPHDRCAGRKHDQHLRSAQAL